MLSNNYKVIGLVVWQIVRGSWTWPTVKWIVMDVSGLRHDLSSYWHFLHLHCHWPENSHTAARLHLSSLLILTVTLSAVVDYFCQFKTVRWQQWHKAFSHIVFACLLVVHKLYMFVNLIILLKVELNFSVARRLQ